MIDSFDVGKQAQSSLALGDEALEWLPDKLAAMHLKKLINSGSKMYLFNFLASSRIDLTTIPEYFEKISEICMSIVADSDFSFKNRFGAFEKIVS